MEKPIKINKRRRRRESERKKKDYLGKKYSYWQTHEASSSSLLSLLTKQTNKHKHKHTLLKLEYVKRQTSGYKKTKLNYI